MEKLIFPKGNGLVQEFLNCLQIMLAHQDWDVNLSFFCKGVGGIDVLPMVCCLDNQAIMRDVLSLNLVPIVLSVMALDEALS